MTVDSRIIVMVISISMYPQCAIFTKHIQQIQAKKATKIFTIKNESTLVWLGTNCCNNNFKQNHTTYSKTCISMSLITSKVHDFDIMN